MVTISDVAKHAGVSTATVSNVINRNGKAKKETEEIVRNAIEELGYIPNLMAKGLKTSQTNSIGIIAEDISAFSSADIIDGICDYSEQNDYSISLCNLRVNRKIAAVDLADYHNLEQSDKFQHILRTSLNQLITSRVDGLIFLGTYPRDVSHLLPVLDIPVVYCYAYTTDLKGCSINYDDFQGAKTAVEYLISCGHEKIALISGSINSIPSHKRMMGYQTALMEHNIPFHPEYIKTGKWRYDDGYQNCCELLQLSDPPTAVFAMSDVMACGAMNAAKDKGIEVPKDLSVHGFDNLELSAYTSPSLSTIELPLWEIGIKAAQNIISRIKGSQDTSAANILLPCRHVERHSVSHKIR